MSDEKTRIPLTARTPDDENVQNVAALLPSNRPRTLAYGSGVTQCALQQSARAASRFRTRWVCDTETQPALFHLLRTRAIRCSRTSGVRRIRLAWHPGASSRRPRQKLGDSAHESAHEEVSLAKYVCVTMSAVVMAAVPARISVRLRIQFEAAHQKSSQVSPLAPEDRFSVHTGCRLRGGMDGWTFGGGAR